MASIRRIKKDINYLISEVLSDCYTFMYLFPDKQREAAIAIIEDAVALHNKLIDRTRKVEGTTKAHFRLLFDDLLKGVDELFRRISELTK